MHQLLLHILFQWQVTIKRIRLILLLGLTGHVDIAFACVVRSVSKVRQGRQKTIRIRSTTCFVTTPYVTRLRPRNVSLNTLPLAANLSARYAMPRMRCFQTQFLRQGFPPSRSNPLASFWYACLYLRQRLPVISTGAAPRGACCRSTPKLIDGTRTCSCIGLPIAAVF